METWLVLFLIAVTVTPVVWYALRKDRRRERAEIDAPDDVFSAPDGRSASVGGSGRGARGLDDRNEGDAGDGGSGDGGGGGGD